MALIRHVIELRQTAVVSAADFFVRHRVTAQLNPFVYSINIDIWICNANIIEVGFKSELISVFNLPKMTGVAHHRFIAM